MNADLVGRIEALAKQKGLTFKSLERMAGIGNGTIRRWNEQSPRLDKILAVAQCLDVSLDQLITIEEGLSPPMKSEVHVADSAQDLGERLLQQLRQQELTQADLCRITGLSTTAVSQYCTGKRVPDTNSLFVLARALGTTMEWLLAGAEGEPKPERRITIGQRIRSRRQSLGLTMKDIAEREGINTGGLSEMENDKYLPSAPTLIALSRALDVSVDWLLGLSQDVPDPALTPDEEQLLAACRSLPPAARLDVLDYALFKLHRPEGQKTYSGDSR